VAAFFDRSVGGSREPCLASVLQRATLKGSCTMAMRETFRTDKLSPQGFKEPADTPQGADLLTNREFEVVSWLATSGVMISVLLVAAYPAFDPLTALLGQFP
jgi:hypothetical protein